MANQADTTLTTIEPLVMRDAEDVEKEELNTETILHKLKIDMKIVIEKLNEVCSVNTAMLGKISELVRENNNLYTVIEEQKMELAELNQYGRRENIEICNIPESVQPKQLEKHVIAALASIKVKVSSYDIVGVHRIGKQQNSRPRNVIVRFINRKNAYTALRNKKQFRNGEYKNYYIIENLCPHNKKLFNRLYKLKKSDDINAVWSYNGNVYCRLDEKDEEPTHIRHMDHIDQLFQESAYEDGGDGDESKDCDESKTTNELDSSTPCNNQTPSTDNVRRRSHRLSDIAEESVHKTPIDPLTIQV